jgi:hypothetical protein
MKYMPADMNIRFCQYLLAGARAAAKRAKVQVPKGLTALRSDRNQFWVEAKGLREEFVQADNAYRTSRYWGGSQSVVKIALWLP